MPPSYTFDIIFSTADAVVPSVIYVVSVTRTHYFSISTLSRLIAKPEKQTKQTTLKKTYKLYTERRKIQLLT